MRTSGRACFGSSRTGISALEVVVLLLLAMVIVAVLAPLVLHTRTPSRRLHCLNNIKNLGFAVRNFQAQQSDKLPLLTSEIEAPEGKLFMVGWPGSLLPFLDEAILYRSIREDPAKVVDPVTGIAKVKINALTCPDDRYNFRVAGGLSYAANAGYMNFDVWGKPEADASLNQATFHTVGTVSFAGTTDFDQRIETHFATGVLWRPVTALVNGRNRPLERKEAPRMAADDIHNGDGLTQTLLFAENIQSRNWASANVNDIGFGICVATIAGGQPDPSAPSGRIGVAGTPLALQKGWSLAGPHGESSAINSNLRSAPGTAPRPSSQHAGGIVNVCFADGHAISLDQSIDSSVYARLVTPAGEKYGQAKVYPGDFE